MSDGGRGGGTGSPPPDGDRPGDGPMRVAVLASGSGTNFQALLDRFGGEGDDAARVVLLVASRDGIGAIDRAERAGVAWRALGPSGRPEDEEARELLDVLGGSGAGLVVLAGYLRKVPVSVVRAYRGRMINIHPALLPSFGGKGMYGHRVHEAVLASGARVTGPTVHFVDEEYDRGRIIAQWPVPVLEGDDADRLAERVLEVEHRILPAVVGALARGEVRLSGDGTCTWREPWFPSDRFLADGRGPGGPR
ncbi:MAG TPA: phosphoribosylglycinamide formyltransferase [Gemmatimonadota bacterium]|nr:phosphoribosylglycinamide formyltransferase [Gemmatimonadota bacterium]